MEKIWINGKFVGVSVAKISVFDRGFMYGDGIFETMRSYAGIVFRLNEHLERFLNSLKMLGISLPYDRRDLKDIIYSCININKRKSAYIRLSATRGEGRFAIGCKDRSNPNVVVLAREFEEYPDWMYKRGLKAKVIDAPINARSSLSGIKSLNFLPFILARLSAERNGFDEAILTNSRGHIAEAATSNIFLVKRRRLFTPSLASGILPGITRKVIIEIAKRLKIGIEERSIARRALLDADEIFLTNSLAEVLPVTKVNSRRIGTGNVGVLTKLFRISYQKEVIREVIR